MSLLWKTSLGVSDIKPPVLPSFKVVRPSYKTTVIRKAVRGYLKQFNEGVGIRKIMEAFPNIDRKKLEYHLTKMKEAGLVKHAGSRCKATPTFPHWFAI